MTAPVSSSQTRPQPHLLTHPSTAVAPLAHRAHSAHDLDWTAARSAAYEAGARARSGAVEIVTLAGAHGRTLAHDLFACSPLPRFASSAMDGWAVASLTGPWQVGSAILAGHVPSVDPLAGDEARPIATGAPVPPGTVAVIRSEHADVLRRPTPVLQLGALAPRQPAVGDHIRPAGEEAEHGDPLLRAGAVLTAPAVALAAVAGYDELPVRAAQGAEILILGDELRQSGTPDPGAVRDAFGPVIPTILTAMGIADVTVRHTGDDAAATVAALASTTAALVVTTGGSSRGPADFVRAAIIALGGRFVVDGVAVRPGHPVMVATLPGDRVVLCLPGNPLAGLLCLAGIGGPLMDGLLGRPERGLGSAVAATTIANAGQATRLVACAESREPATIGSTGGIVPVGWQGSGMLRGLAQATVVAVVPPGGIVAGSPLHTVPLPW